MTSSKYTLYAKARINNKAHGYQKHFFVRLSPHVQFIFYKPGWKIIFFQTWMNKKIHTASMSRRSVQSPFIVVFLSFVTCVSWQFSSFVAVVLWLNPTHLDSFWQREWHFISTATDPTLWLDMISSGGSGGPSVKTRTFKS